jgi:hypothetical protein
MHEKQILLPRVTYTRYFPTHIYRISIRVIVEGSLIHLVTVNNCGLLTVAVSPEARNESSGMYTYMYGSPGVDLLFLTLHQRVRMTHMYM